MNSFHAVAHHQTLYDFLLCSVNGQNEELEIPEKKALQVEMVNRRLQNTKSTEEWKKWMKITSHQLEDCIPLTIKFNLLVAFYFAKNQFLLLEFSFNFLSRLRKKSTIITVHLTDSQSFRWSTNIAFLFPVQPVTSKWKKNT